MTTTTERRPSLVRLTGVELRKFADTRAGRWLFALIGVASVALVVVQLVWEDDAALTYVNIFLPTLLPTAVLLPVLGILLVTSEWSQRTVMHTFALVPQRWRVLVAKLGAAGLAAVVSVLLGLVFAALGTVLADATGGAGTWDMTVTVVGQALLFQLINVVMGVAFGALLLSSPLAIVLFFAIPLLLSTLGALIAGLHRPAQWLDLNMTLAPLAGTGALDDAQWARLGTSVALWLLVPLVVGAARVLRSEIA